jgi:hypothetical protein
VPESSDDRRSRGRSRTNRAAAASVILALLPIGAIALLVVLDVELSERAALATAWGLAAVELVAAGLAVGGVVRAARGARGLVTAIVGLVLGVLGTGFTVLVAGLSTARYLS